MKVKPISNSLILNKNQNSLITAAYNLFVPCVIAGGSVRRVFSQPHESDEEADIDIWFTSKKFLAEKVYYWKDYIVSENENVYSLSIPINGKHQKVQFIKNCNFYISDILGKFDFTICQFAYWGNQYYAFDDKPLTHLQNKHLIVNTDCPTPIQEYRYYKYINAGFIPPNNKFTVKDAKGEEKTIFVHTDETGKPFVFIDGKLCEIIFENNQTNLVHDNKVVQNFGDYYPDEWENV